MTRIETRIKTFSRTALLTAITLACASACGSGQVSEPVPFPEYVAAPVGPAPVEPIVAGAAPVTAPVIFSGDQLDQLLAPIALYPDPLLAEMLPASTYPQDVAAAAQWLQATPNPTQEAIDAQSWDPTVKAMAHYPTVLQYMAGNMDWTQALGAAFINQPQDVMDSVQGLRTLAQSDQNLQTNSQAQVVQDNGAIRIEPVNPDVIYVPAYDPVLVYTQACPVSYGPAYPIGDWCDNDFDWPAFYIVVGDGWDHRWRHPPEWDHRPHDGGRDGRGGRDPHAPGTVPGRWTHNPVKPAPHITVSAVHQLGLDHPNPPAGHRTDGNRAGNAGRGTLGTSSDRPLPTIPRNRAGDLPIKPPASGTSAPHTVSNGNTAPRDRTRGGDRPAVQPQPPAAEPAPAPVIKAQAPRPTVRVPRVTTDTPAVSPPAPHLSVPAPRPEPSRPSAPTVPSIPAPIVHESAPAPRLSIPEPHVAPPAPRVSEPAEEVHPRVAAPHFDAPSPAPRMIVTPPPEPAPAAPPGPERRGGPDNQGTPPGIEADSPGGRGRR